MNQTKSLSPRDFLESVPNACRREDAFQLLDLFQRVTGYEAKMWGGSIVGFGRYDYTYDTGHSGACHATGFSPRAGKMSIYIMPGYNDYGSILDRLGPHKMGKACLYVGRLNKIDLDVLAELIEVGVRDLNKIWPVHPV
ncbi:MAG: DUF1801 domain-containing protein [Pseudomonadota bacterium]